MIAGRKRELFVRGKADRHAHVNSAVSNHMAMVRA